MDHIKAYLVHSMYVPTNFHRQMQKLVIKVFQLSRASAIMESINLLISVNNLSISLILPGG